MKARQIQPKSNSLEDLQDYIAELSSVVRDKSPKSAEKLWNRLLTESYGGAASRVFEYIPCKLDAQATLNLLERTNNFQFFGFFKDGFYFTNAREVLNWGSTFDEIINNEFIDFTNYKVFKCEAPYLIYGQISTHCQLTTVSHSQRYADCNRGYFIPHSVDKWIENNIHDGRDIQMWWDEFVETSSPKELKHFMKATCGEVRKEIFDRGSDMLQNRVFCIGGYTNNPNAWEHFKNQRSDKHTQLETREFVTLLNTLYL